jgi:hypothetical protein
MNISHDTYDSIEQLIFNENLRISSLSFDKSSNCMLVYLNNDSTLIINIQSYPRLESASPDQLHNYSLIANGIGIYWPDVDVDLSLKGFLRDMLRQLVESKNALVIS